MAETGRQEVKGGIAATQPRGPFHPGTARYRFTILLFICLLTFGSYFAYDSVSALETTLMKALGLQRETIGSLYSAY